MRASNTFSILFFVKKHRISNGKVPIYLRITANGKRLDLSVKRRIDADKWDEARGVARGSRQEIKALNMYLDQVKNHLYECHHQLEKEKKLVTAEAIKHRYLGKDDRGKTLSELMEYHNEEMKDELAWGTQKNYFTTQKYVCEFLHKKLKTSNIFLEELNYKFVKDFEKYLKHRTPDGHQKPCGQNGAMKHIQRLKKMINLAIKEEWLVKDPFQKFKLKLEKKDRGYLTKEELKRIAEKVFPIDRLDQTRDIFIFSCYTGLSYAEVFDLTSNNIVVGLDGNHWIQGQRRKSKEWFKVPILPQAKAIIKKYQDHPLSKTHGKVLPVYTNQKTNAYLKEIAILCKISKNLTFHLARHTFATTITLSNGVPIESVSKMLGHTNLRTTQLYAKVVEQKLSEDMKMLKGKLTESTYEKKMTS
ncbi:integrase/recombinase XerD [Catalinimonas alkaloidigena]|jgi:site-specific recombinase XerD|uniref:site-specific integrase n=1 Tax=Catalinimonas TaxID=1522128 RepID=UPI0024076F6F|nr:site-specific integrase [Catalinimonas alkaloidigena]MDF9799070.1 integrase/recombinase XerD [Catalinimonas alkaloidigena]